MTGKGTNTYNQNRIRLGGLLFNNTNNTWRYISRKGSMLSEPEFEELLKQYDYNINIPFSRDMTKESIKRSIAQLQHLYFNLESDKPDEPETSTKLITKLSDYSKQTPTNITIDGITYASKVDAHKQLYSGDTGHKKLSYSSFSNAVNELGQTDLTTEKIDRLFTNKRRGRKGQEVTIDDQIYQSIHDAYIKLKIAEKVSYKPFSTVVKKLGGEPTTIDEIFRRIEKAKRSSGNAQPVTVDGKHYLSKRQAYLDLEPNLDISYQVFIRVLNILDKTDLSLSEIVNQSIAGKTAPNNNEDNQFVSPLYKAQYATAMDAYNDLKPEISYKVFEQRYLSGKEKIDLIKPTPNLYKPYQPFKTLNDLLWAKKMSISQFASTTKIPVSTISGIIAGRYAPKIDTASRISREFGLDVESLWSSAFYTLNQGDGYTKLDVSETKPETETKPKQATVETKTQSRQAVHPKLGKAEVTSSVDTIEKNPTEREYHRHDIMLAILQANDLSLTNDLSQGVPLISITQSKETEYLLNKFHLNRNDIIDWLKSHNTERRIVDNTVMIFGLKHVTNDNHKQAKKRKSNGLLARLKFLFTGKL